MLITIIAILITLLPGIFIAYADMKEKEKKERERKMIEKVRNRISLKAIEMRFPFVSLIEYYYLKRHFYPYFAKTELSKDDAWQMRKKLCREIMKRVGG